MLATYSNETVKSIQTFIDGSQGGNILREEIEWKLQQGGMIAVAKELKGLIRKGTFLNNELNPTILCI